MVDCLNAAHYFIRKSYDDGMEAEMTNMKLQKLLYYAQSLHLALYDEPLFDEEIQAWQRGPVCKTVYRVYNEYGGKPLPPPNPDFRSNIPDDKIELLEETWEYFGGYHAYQLSNMTHGEFPWQKARKGLPSDARSTEPILREDMKALGEQKLDEIERQHPAYESVISEVLEEAFTSSYSNLIGKGEVSDWLNSLLD
ncbi:MAG: SocA family protein [Moorea sp. SIO2I5]|nr:SocA family protein [Moorena sp. SIO2I5]